MWFGKGAKIRSMREPLYRVHLDTFACRVRTTVNDCPVTATRGKRSLKAAYSVNGWLLQGDNFLKITIDPLEGQDALDGDKAFLRGKATVGDMTVPQDRREEVEQFTFELDLSQDTGAYPIVIEETLDVPTAFPRWGWTRAPVLTVDDALRTQAARAVLEVWDALQHRDLDRVLDLQRVRVREMSESMHQPIDERIADTRADLELLTGDATSRLRPLDADAYVYPLFGDGRIVRVDSAPDSPAIRYDFPETTVFAGIPMLLSRNSTGGLEWVR